MKRSTPGKSRRQFLAQRADIFRGRPMVFVQLDLDIAVLRADRAAVVVGHVDAARPASRYCRPCVASSSGGMIWRIAFRFRRIAARFPRSRVPTRHARMHQDLAGIDRREKVAAEEGHQRERRDHDRPESRRRRRRGGAAPSPAARDSRGGMRSKRARTPRCSRTSGLRDGGSGPSRPCMSVCGACLRSR